MLLSTTATSAIFTSSATTGGEDAIVHKAYAFVPASIDDSLAMFLSKLAFFFPLVDPTFATAAAILLICFLDSVD